MYPHHFATSDLQFGIKKGMSTSLCTVHNSSSVFGYFLDSSKAFDHVNHDILFSKLMERGIPPILNHFLLSWYKSQRMQVWWNATLSPAFSVTNGVWQGGVLSPILFTICMDDLLSGLKDLGIGCYTGTVSLLGQLVMLMMLLFWLPHHPPYGLCCTAVRIMQALKA